MDYHSPPKKISDTIFYIEVSKVHPNSQQPRREFDEFQLKELAESIKQYGILQPLLVTRKETEVENGTLVEYELIAGERRLRAAKLAGLKEVPVIIRKEEPEKVKLELALIENIQREDLNSIEKARAFNQLSEEFGMTHREIGVRVGKSRMYVSNLVRLLNLPYQVRDAVTQGKITEGHARSLLMLEDRPEEQQKLFSEIIEKNLSVRDTEYAAGSIAREKTRKQKNIYLQELRALESNFANVLGTNVTINRKGGDSGKISIDFNSIQQLEFFYNFLALARKKVFPQNETLLAKIDIFTNNIKAQTVPSAEYQTRDGNSFLQNSNLQQDDASKNLTSNNSAPETIENKEEKSETFETSAIEPQNSELSEKQEETGLDLVQSVLNADKE